MTDNSTRPFWLRTQHVSGGAVQVYCVSNGSIEFADHGLHTGMKFVPAIHLNTSAVSFLSKAPAVTEIDTFGVPTITVDNSKAYIIRYNSEKNLDGTETDDKVKSQVKLYKQCIEVKKGSDDEYLYIQFKDGGTEKVFCKKINDSFSFDCTCIGISKAEGFANCKVWVEKNDNGLIYARKIEEETTDWASKTVGHDLRYEIEDNVLFIDCGINGCNYCKANNARFDFANPSDSVYDCEGHEVVASNPTKNTEQNWKELINKPGNAWYPTDYTYEVKENGEWKSLVDSDNKPTVPVNVGTYRGVCTVTDSTPKTYGTPKAYTIYSNEYQITPANITDISFANPTPSAIQALPASSVLGVSSEKYTAELTWDKNPALCDFNTAYKATITFTAKNANYRFTDKSECLTQINTSGDTWVLSQDGGATNNTLVITRTFTTRKAKVVSISAIVAQTLGSVADDEEGAIAQLVKNFDVTVESLNNGVVGTKIVKDVPVSWTLVSASFNADANAMNKYKWEIYASKLSDYDTTQIDLNKEVEIKNPDHTHIWQYAANTDSNGKLSSFTAKCKLTHCTNGNKEYKITVARTGAIYCKSGIGLDFYDTATNSAITFSGCAEWLGQGIKKPDILFKEKGSNGDFSGIYPSQAGDYIARLKLMGENKEDLVEAEVDFTIAKVYPEVYHYPEIPTYVDLPSGGAGVDIVSAGACTFDTRFLYRITKKDSGEIYQDWSDKLPTIKVKGKYFVEYYIESKNRNYKDFGSKSEPLGSGECEVRSDSYGEVPTPKVSIISATSIELKDDFKPWELKDDGAWVVQYGVSTKSDVLPTDWINYTVLIKLVPETTYYIFAKVSYIGGKIVDPSYSSPCEVKTIAYKDNGAALDAIEVVEGINTVGFAYGTSINVNSILKSEPTFTEGHVRKYQGGPWIKYVYKGVGTTAYEESETAPTEAGNYVLIVRGWCDQRDCYAEVQVPFKINAKPSGGGNSSGGGSSSETKPDPAITKEPDGTVKETTTVTDEKTGTTTVEEKKTDPDGTVTVTKTETSKDGTVKETSTETKPDGTVTESETEKKADGTVTEKAVETKPDGTVTETVSEEKPDGSKTEIEKVVEPDGAVTETETEIKKDGSKTVETTEISADGKEEKSVGVSYSANGTPKAAEVEVAKVTESKKLTVSVADIKQMAQKTGVPSKNTTITLTAKTETGKEKYSVDIEPKNLSKSTLVVYALDKKGNLVVVDTTKNTAKVTKSGNLSLSISGSGDFKLLSTTEAKKAEKAILNTVEPAKANTSVKEGEKTKFKLSSDCNKANIKSIKYETTNKNVKVDKNGNITAKKSGTTTVKATITLNNGKTKTVKMKVKVK